MWPVYQGADHLSTQLLRTLRRAHTQGFLSRKKSTAINLHQELLPWGAGCIEILPESVWTILRVWAFSWWAGLLFPLDACAKNLPCVIAGPLSPWEPSSVHAARTDRFPWVFRMSQLMEDSGGDWGEQGTGAQLLPYGIMEGWQCLSPLLGGPLSLLCGNGFLSSLLWPASVWSTSVSGSRSISLVAPLHLPQLCKQPLSHCLSHRLCRLFSAGIPRMFKRLMTLKSYEYLHVKGDCINLKEIEHGEEN